MVTDFNCFGFAIVVLVVQTNLEIVRWEQAKNGANGEITLYDFQ
jgi:hypothetical protein